VNVPQEIEAALNGRAPTEQQWAAIGAPLEPAVLIAGAGSGKTAVMAARIVWLVLNGHASGNEILGLTFTNKAADELRSRVRRALAPLGLGGGEEPAIETYHSFASRMIADEGLRAGIEPNATLLSDAQVWQLTAQVYMRRTFKHMEVRNLWHVQYIRQLAEDCANHLVAPEEVIAYDTAFLERVENNDVSRRVLDAARKRIELAEVVAAYAEEKQRRHVIDYGDQIRLAYEIAGDPLVAADFRARYRFALLDEYQDTNVAQARMLHRLMDGGYPVMAVGDPDQNIYGWRGASLYNLLGFRTTFRKADGSPAETYPLEVNFRSGRTILDLANVVIGKVHPERRAEKVLRHFEKLGEGGVAAGLYEDESREAEAIAGRIVDAHAAGTPWGEIAVLCRKKRLFGALLEALREREIPVEVSGLGGLLKMPEVTDLVALLRVLEDPMRNVALARLLRGPRWRIGHRDLALIGRHATARNRDLREQTGDDSSPGEIIFSLAETVKDIDEVEGVSDEARARIRRFNEELADLRAHAHVPLPELVARALDSLGIVRELDASPSPAAPAAKRNIAGFLDRVAAFRPLEGEPTLSSLVEWLDAVDETDEDMEASQPTESDSVKLMTIHQAKGLEFDVVAIPGLARGLRSQIFPDTSRRANPVTTPKNMPIELRGDREVFPKIGSSMQGFLDEMKVRAEEEERRLLYVAVTRARKHLFCTAAWWYYPSGMDEQLTTPLGPSEFFDEIASFEGAEVLMRTEEPPEPNPLIAQRAQRAKRWPADARRAPDPDLGSGLADAVKAARAATTPDDSLFPSIAPARAPAVPRGLPVSALVTYAECPKEFYWSYVRPLPRRPSAAARIGTIVHAFIEEQGRRQMPLYDPDDFTRRAAGEDHDKIARLKAAFRGSRFGGRAPVLSEQAFAIVLRASAGEFVVQGRVDAIFERDGGGWEIVDWKTGRAPARGGESPDGAPDGTVHADDPQRWQLDLYALAAQEIWGKAPEDLSLTFVYLGADEVVERSVPVRPAEIIRKELLVALESIGASEFAASPSPACMRCDFLRHCAPGRAYAAARA
jgi:DNA helicase-2/ATP-dependent DNA helicase PcrA